MSSKFVNYRKRGISLPPGCKDLIDVLERLPYAPQPSNAESEQDVPEIREAHFHTAGLLQVERFVSMLVGSSAKVFVLMVTVRDDQPPMVLYRKRGERAVILSLSSEDLSQAQAVRKLLDQLNMVSLFNRVPEDFRALTYVLPNEASKVAEILTTLLRELYGISEVAGLDFRYYEG